MLARPPAPPSVFSPDGPPRGAKASPATARNRRPILEALRPRLPDSGLVLEIGAGAGEHALHNAAAMPGLQWLPTDPDADALASIAAWREYAGGPNLLAPLRLNASKPDDWPIGHADAVVNINMIHIAPWAAAGGLMIGAGRLLPAGGILFLYGPFFEDDVETARSNIAFDLDLRRRDAAWGIRGLSDVAALAARQGLSLAERLALPANNLALFFRKA